MWHEAQRKRWHFIYTAMTSGANIVAKIVFVEIIDGQCPEGCRSDPLTAKENMWFEILKHETLQERVRVGTFETVQKTYLQLAISQRRGQS